MYIYGGTLIPDGVAPDAIAAADRLFSQRDFLDFARSVFGNVHGAVARGNRDALGSVVGEPLRTALLERNGRGAWSRPVKRIDHTSILDATHGATDTITVRFGAVIGGSKVVEDWVFERDARSYPHLTGVLVTSCANCGAPLATDERGNCRYCATHLVGVAGNWVVRGVLPPRIIEGSEGPKRSDELGPEHNLQALLEFASSVYLNVHRAVLAGEALRIHSLLTNDMRHNLQTAKDEYQPWTERVQRVDRVSLVGVSRGAVEIATVRVEATAESRGLVEDWAFERPASMPGHPIPSAAAECPFCGAPITLDEHGNCRFCRTHLLGVAGDWRLCRVTEPTATHSAEWFVRLMQSRIGQLLVLAYVLAVLWFVIWGIPWP